jgi:transposase-like protein
MSLRRFILWFMPEAMKKAAEANSRAWLSTCKHCGAENSVWDIGGIRYKAAGEFMTRVKCQNCGKFGFTTFTQRKA